MTDDLNIDLPAEQAVPRVSHIRIVFWVGLALLLLAAAISRSGKRRAGVPAGVPTSAETVEVPADQAGVAVRATEAPAPPMASPMGPPFEQLHDEQVLEAQIVEELALPDADPEAPDEPAPKRTRKGKRKRSVGGRIAFWVGIGMIAAGLGLLGYVAWQLWGTNWASQRHQREITAQLQKDWSSDRGCTVNCPTGAATALIRIPKFGRDYQVPVLEGVSPDVLAKGFGHFKESADPGEVGNYALAGHRVTHGEPLRKMPQLRPGDEVIVETRTATYTYVLDTNPNDLIVPFTGVWVVDPLPKNPRAGGPQPAQQPGQRLITLTTCSEIFHTDNRMISFGHLVSSVPKTASVEG